MVQTKQHAAPKIEIEAIVDALGLLDRAITPRGIGGTLVTGGHDATGGYVTSLTEAMMGVTAGLCRIAESIDRYTDVVKNQNKR
jgi:hypothetical protein